MTAKVSKNPLIAAGTSWYNHGACPMPTGVFPRTEFALDPARYLQPAIDTAEHSIEEIVTELRRLRERRENASNHAADAFNQLIAAHRRTTSTGRPNEATDR